MFLKNLKRFHGQLYSIQELHSNLLKVRFYEVREEVKAI